MTQKLFQHLEEALPCFVQLGTRELCVATPYLTAPGLSAFVDALSEQAIDGSRWLTSLTLQNAVSGATEPDAVLTLLRLGASVRTLASLHAKLYLLPTGSSQILGSANLTNGGLRANEEIVLWSTDVQLTSGATELFDRWWARARDVASAQAHELKREADRAEGLHGDITALTRLMALGAFVTITTSRPEAQQEHTIQVNLEDLGVPPPGPGDIRPSPPTLLLWPPEMRNAVSRARRTCDDWLKRKTFEHNRRKFLPRIFFAKLDDIIEEANLRLRDDLASITESEWQQHRTSLKAQVRAWFKDIANEQRRDEKWAEEKVDAIVKTLPNAGDFGKRISIGRRMEVPHPASESIEELVEVLHTEWRQHIPQEALPGLT